MEVRKFESEWKRRGDGGREGEIGDIVTDRLGNSNRELGGGGCNKSALAGS